MLDDEEPEETLNELCAAARPALHYDDKTLSPEDVNAFAMRKFGELNIKSAKSRAANRMRKTSSRSEAGEKLIRLLQ